MKPVFWGMLTTGRSFWFSCPIQACDWRRNLSLRAVKRMREQMHRFNLLLWQPFSGPFWLYQLLGLLVWGFFEGGGGCNSYCISDDTFLFGHHWFSFSMYLPVSCHHTLHSIPSPGVLYSLSVLWHTLWDTPAVCDPRALSFANAQLPAESISRLNAWYLSKPVP